jgi:tRNA threonylcarbamoyladenosine biosynthesis protein TsaE
VFSRVKESKSPEDTFQIGLDLAKDLALKSCLLITGELGAGKTQLIKGLCAYFKIDPLQVQSPTYSLHHSYKQELTIHHFDLYRLSNSQEFLDRGFLDVLDMDELCFIEWPSKVDEKLFLNRDCLHIRINIEPNSTRIIEIGHD